MSRNTAQAFPRSPRAFGGLSDGGSVVSEPEDDSADIFQEAGIELPSHLNTKSRRWASLLLVTVSGAFAFGPLASWPTLEPLLIKEGVWKGPDQLHNLSAVFSIGAAVFCASALAAGIMYDVIGPRAVGVIGAFGAAASLALMALAIKVRSLNNLLWIAYPAANVFGFANQLDIFAWLWLLPEDQNMVTGIAAAVQVFSDTFCLVAVWMDHTYGVPIEVYFLIAAFLSVIAGFLALWLVPSQQDVRRISKAVINHRTRQARGASPRPAGQNYGTIDGLPNVQDERSTSEEDDTVWGALSQSWTNINKAVTVYSKVHPRISFIFFFYILASYMFVMYPAIESYPLYIELVGKRKAVDLVNTFGLVYGCIGAVSVLLMGKFMDVVDMAWAVGWMIVPTMLNAYFYKVPTVQSQITAQILLSATSSLCLIMLPRFVTLYGPPELFGSMGGLLGGFMGVGQMLLTPLGTRVCEALFCQGTKAHSPCEYLATIDMWCFFTVVTSLLLLRWWWYEPLPPPGTTTLAHVQKYENAPEDEKLSAKGSDTSQPHDVADQP